ncbi:hypothetical protein HNR56_004182, partial [Roseospira marina]|nr:hypothetical protein [Roseospira marina]MBB5089453.1 hypothetical protein [Roseospira marina]
MQPDLPPERLVFIDETGASTKMARLSRPKRYELSPEQWDRIKDLLPGKPGDPGRSG